MAENLYRGEVKARLIEVRFAISGKIARCLKKSGETCRKGDLLASLDRKMLQTELDRQLADYEKIRADFEIFAQKTPDPQNAVDKYLKSEKQAQLNASVKDVELAKAKLDQCDLFSPANGFILDDGNIIPNLNITPSSSYFKIIDTDSYYFEFEIPQKEYLNFSRVSMVTISFEIINHETKCNTAPAISDGKRLIIRAGLDDKANYFWGLGGIVKEVISNGSKN